MIGMTALLMFTLYELKFTPMLDTSDQREIKVQQIKGYLLVTQFLILVIEIQFVLFLNHLEKFIIQSVLLFLITTMPHEIFTTLYNFGFLANEQDFVYYESVQLVLNFIRLFSFFTYNLGLLIIFEKLKWKNIKKVCYIVLNCWKYCCGYRKRFDLTDRYVNNVEVYALREK